MLARNPVRGVQSFGQRRVEQVGAVAMQAVEEIGPQQQFPGILCAEPAHRLLERPRPTGVIQRQRLTVEHHRPARQRAGECHQFRHAAGDFPQRAGVHMYLVTVPVNLDPGTVQFVLHAGCAHIGECGVQRVGRRGQHRPDRRAQSQPE